jgi:hypothetical protein
VWTGSGAWGDYDNDGDLDVLLTGYAVGLGIISRVYRNDGGAVFTDVPTGLPGVDGGSAAWGDYDNDGDLDILLTGLTDSELVSRVYRSDGAPANTPPAAPGGLSTQLAGDALALSWNESTDGQTPAAGLCYNLRIGTTPGGSEIMPAMADAVNGYRRVVQLGNAQKRTSWTVRVPPGSYYWSVQAVDGAYAGSAFAGELGPPSFTDITAGLPGGGPAVWGDYDSDGDLDILLTGEGGSGVYRNDGGGLFTDITAGLPAGGSASWGDYDNDGDLDILLTGEGGASVYRNDGGGVFTDINVGLPGVNDGSAWGDYDNDGDLDILLTGGNGSGLYRNDGGGVFTNIPAGLREVYDSSVAWGDYDNDGDMDILMTGMATSAPPFSISVVYRNDGGGVFTDAGAGLPGVYWGATAWGDYDNDGDLDILLTGSTDGSGIISRVYRNDGGGVFTDAGAGLPGVTVGSSAWGDYDNDGDLDILLTGYYMGGPGIISRVYRNEGGAVFTDITAGLPGVDGGSAAWGDYDNDGDLDILLTGNTGSEDLSRVYRSDGAPANTPPAAPGGLSAQLAGDALALSWNASTDDQTPAAGLCYNLRIGTTPGGSEIMPAMADAVNGYRRVVQLGNAQKRTSWTVRVPPGVYYWSVQAVDGAYAGSAFAAEQSAGPVSFTDITAGLPGGGSVAWGDYDNDGDLDILLTGEGGSGVYRNDGGGLFTDIIAGLPGGGLAAWGDYDNDGDLDILLTGAGDSGVYRNDGGGVFTDVNAGLPGVDDGSAAWGDYDNDGDLDILLTGDTGSEYVSRVYRNDGGGVFTNIPVSLMGLLESSAAWGDYDNDGDLDILLTGYFLTAPPHAVSLVYRNDGGGVFTWINAGLTGVCDGSVAWGDYDNDGDLDVLLTGPSVWWMISVVYRNDGGGVFTDIAAGLPGGDSAAWGDYDNDGDLDILLTGGGGTRVYRNDGGGVFTDITAGLPGGGSAAWGDYDNDGDLDILLTAGGGSSVYRSDGAPANTPPAAPGGLSAQLAGDALALSWSASTDGQTPGAGLCYNLRIGTTPGGSEIMPPMANAVNGYRRVVQLGNAQKRTSWTVRVPPGTYRWSVQALDGAHAGSAFAPEQSIDAPYRTYLVRPDGTGDFPTIQAAIQAAAHGDTIELADGTFTGPGNRDVEYLGKLITVRSQSGNRDACIIDAQGSENDPHRGFHFRSGEGSASVLQGVTITHGYAPYVFPNGAPGGGIYCESSSSPTLFNCTLRGNWGDFGGGCAVWSNATITNCTFVDNVAEYWGGGAFCCGSSVFEGCRFQENHAPWGGGLGCTGSAVLRRCAFVGNVAQAGGGLCAQFGGLSLEETSFAHNLASLGGGVCLNPEQPTGSEAVPAEGALFGRQAAERPMPENGMDPGDRPQGPDRDFPVFTRCTFSSNSSQRGGAALCRGASPTAHFEECTFFGNTAPYGSGIGADGTPLYPASVTLENTIVSSGAGGEAVGCSDGSATLTCCDVYGNAGGDWVGCIAGQHGVDGNVSLDPILCLPDSGDFHLGFGSPCLDAPGCGRIGAYGAGCGWGITSITDVGNDQGRQVRVRWQHADCDAPGLPCSVTYYSLWRRIDQDRRGDRRPSGREAPDLRFYPPGEWDFVKTVPAWCQESYSTVCPTLCDSTISHGMCWSVFFLAAHTEAPGIYFECLPDSGCSLDNLAPGVPRNFHLAPPTILVWDECPEVDFDYFAVYGSETDSLDGAAELLGYTIEPTMDITGHPHGFYHVTATDLAGNEGEEASSYGLSGIPAGGRVPDAFALHACVPNPASLGTTFSFDVPGESEVALTVFDVRGRVVRVLVHGRVRAGSHAMRWDGTDESGRRVGAGAYFCKMAAPGYGATRGFISVR